jgi:hypothetical protein
LAPASVLPLLVACGCGTPAQVATGGGHEERDLSRLVVWHTQDLNVVSRRATGGYKTIQTFYDRSGRRLGGLDLGYVFEWRHQILFSEDLSAAARDDESCLWGFVDRAGRVVIPFQFDYAFPFASGHAVVAVNDSPEFETRRVGLIDRQGKWTVPAGKYEELWTGSEGRWPFLRTGTRDRDDERWGFLDANGAVVVESRYKTVGDYSEGLSVVQDGNSFAFIDRQGRTALRLPDNVKDARGFSCGRARVVVRMGPKPPVPESPWEVPAEPPSRHGFMARDGTMVIKPVYTAAGSFSEGLAPVSMSEKAFLAWVEDETVDGFFGPPDDGHRWGFVDPSGKLVIPMKFNRVSKFSEGRARARINGKWGFIDKTGEFVIPPRYEWVQSFQNGIAEAVLDRKIILIDRQGKTMVNTGKAHEVF